MFHGSPWNIPWNSMELSNISFGGTRVPWNSMLEYSMEFHGTKLYFIWRYQSSMEFHWIFHGIPWNTCVIWNGTVLIPWNCMELGDFLATPDFHWIQRIIPCKSRVTCYWLKWQSQSSMEFHGIKWYFIWRHQSSMEFHGMPWNTCGISNGALLIAWNRMRRGDLLFGDSRVSWNSMEYPMAMQGNMLLNKMTISKFHGIPWN